MGETYQQIRQDGAFVVGADKTDTEFLSIGQRGVRRHDGYEKASGKAIYTRDIQIPGMLYARVMRSPYAHARIVSIDEVKIVGGVAERFAGDIVEGTPVEITIDNCPDAGCTTDISYVGDTVNPDSRTFSVEVILPNPDRTMKPGMIANMLILTERIEDALIVPQEAVVRSEDGYQVFVVVSEEGREVSRVRDVILGPARDDRVVIAEGLAAGDRVVTVGQLKLGNGDLVSVVDAVNGTGSSEGEGR